MFTIMYIQNGQLMACNFKNEIQGILYVLKNKIQLEYIAYPPKG